jgi:MFS family permease
MSEKNPKFDMDFLLQWILANAVGWAVAAGLVVLVPVPLGLILIPDHLYEDLSCGLLVKVFSLGSVVAGFVFGAFVGVIVGIMQGLVLRRRILMSGRWVLACALGWGFAFGIAVFSLVMVRISQWSVLERFGESVVWALVGALGGSFSGIMQWLVLKPQVSRSSRWVVVSTLGWAMALSVGGYCIYVSDWVFMLDVGISSIIGGIVTGIVGGGITGISLTWLLRSPSLGSNKTYDSAPLIGCVLFFVLISILTGSTYYIQFIGPPIIWDTDPDNMVLSTGCCYVDTYTYAQIWGDGRITWRNGTGYLTQEQIKALFRRVMDVSGCIDLGSTSGVPLCITLKLQTVEKRTCINSWFDQIDYPSYADFFSLFHHITSDGAGARSSP